MQDLYWKITRDTANREEYADCNRKGTTGPRDANTALPLTIRFRLVTDDWPEVKDAYYGLAANEESIEYALDGFGTPDYGMTAAHIWHTAHGTQNNKGKWEPFI